jgi:rhodanese-related sulfurtransferase
MDAREFKDAVFQHFAQIGAAFGSPKRVELIDLLAQGERHVEALADAAGLSVANTSRHLQVLKAVNLVASRKQGLLVIYRLADPTVLSGYHALQSLAEDRLAEVSRLTEQYFSSVDGLEPVGKAELLRRMRSGDVIVVDVRPPEEYAAGHIAGSVSAPLTQLQRSLARLPKRRRVVAYCRGPYCVLAAQAVRLMRARGLDAVRLEDGYPEWRDAGLPVEAAPEPKRRIAEKRR